jgi:hypothetical protein
VIEAVGFPEMWILIPVCMVLHPRMQQASNKLLRVSNLTRVLLFQRHSFMTHLSVTDRIPTTLKSQWTRRTGFVSLTILITSVAHGSTCILNLASSDTFALWAQITL